MGSDIEYEINHDLENIYMYNALVQEFRKTVKQIYMDYCGENQTMQCVGRIGWALLEATVTELPCPTCSGEGKAMISFFHDMVNLKKGKPLFAPENYQAIKEMICGGAVKPSTSTRL